MVAAQAGDRAAYESLLHDCIPFIKRVARGQGIRPDFIDDVVQETLLTVHQARHTYDPNRSFTAWLRTIAQRRAIDGLRRAGRTRTREIYAPLAYENHSDPSGDPEEPALQNDHTEVLDLAIGKLSAGQREAVEHLALQVPIACAGCNSYRTVDRIASGRLASRSQDLARQLGGKD